MAKAYWISESLKASKPDKGAHDAHQRLHRTDIQQGRSEVLWRASSGHVLEGDRLHTTFPGKRPESFAESPPPVRRRSSLACRRQIRPA